jgi:uncharacterized membrane protein
VDLVLIVVGFGRTARGPRLFAPSVAAIHAAPLAVSAARVLLASSNMPTHIRRAVRLPMPIGVLLWSIVHLLANGDLRATILFGAFAAYAAVDLVSAVARHAVKRFVPRARFDAIAIVAGIAIAWLVMTFHRTLFGVAVVPFGA